MKVQPLSRITQRPYAILYAGRRSMGVDSLDGRQVYEGRRAIEKALQDLSGHVLYVHSSLEQLKHTTGALSWKMTAWKGRQTGMVHLPSGVRVSSLRQTLIESQQPFEDLTAVMKWVSGYGVPAGSISGMAWNLFRASLSRELVISSEIEVGRSAFYGGRQEIRQPRKYQHMMAADITAAYPHAMASRDYALSLREVSRDTVIDPEEPGIARAIVQIPSNLPYGPLPLRIDAESIQFPYGVITGTWSWCELDAAAQLGCTVKVEQCWAPRRRAEIFFPWWQMAQTGRRLPGEASKMAKAIMNSTWGQFAMSGEDRSEVQWSDDAGVEPYEIRLDPRQMPQLWTTHIAAETTARVRRRMLLEGLYGETKQPVHIDTDGIIISASSPLPADSGNDFGQWRRKTEISELDLRAPQLYRYLCGSACGTLHPAWHYVASGMSQPVAQHYFEEHRHVKTSVAYFGAPDRVIPRGYAGDFEQIKQWTTEARGIA